MVRYAFVEHSGNVSVFLYEDPRNFKKGLSTFPYDDLDNEELMK